MKKPCNLIFWICRIFTEELDYRLILVVISTPLLSLYFRITHVISVLSDFYNCLMVMKITFMLFQVCKKLKTLEINNVMISRHLLACYYTSLIITALHLEITKLCFVCFCYELITKFSTGQCRGHTPLYNQVFYVNYLS